MSSRMRVTKGHRNNRRSHHGTDGPTITIDKETGTPHLRHRANPTTGMYRGRKVMDINSAVKESKADKKAPVKEEKAETKTATKADKKEVKAKKEKKEDK